MHALNELTERILGAAIEVHRMKGPGLLESAYEECLGYELSRLGLEFKRQVQLPIAYKGLKLDCGYRLDLLLEDSVIVELKTVDRLQWSGRTIGLLMNFNEPVLKDGLKRSMN